MAGFHFSKIPVFKIRGERVVDEKETFFLRLLIPRMALIPVSTVPTVMEVVVGVSSSFPTPSTASVTMVIVPPTQGRLEMIHQKESGAIYRNMHAAYFSYLSFFRKQGEAQKPNIQAWSITLIIKFERDLGSILIWYAYDTTAGYIVQLVASEIFPLPVVKGLLYPGAIVNGLINNMSFPSWDNLLSIYNLTDIKQASTLTNLQRLELLLCGWCTYWYSKTWEDEHVFGTLLVIWGLVKEGIHNKPANSDPTKAVFVYPTMLIALVCAFLTVKYDVKKVARSAPARPVAKPLHSSSKAMLK
ncbi:hypothetical protein Adt_10735 [Abeliophyllum distichum]|uniref:Uncharacterized protein n=1 Tax=Abeliophyllum distichum TaxID=126358 RepID=A0ABD1UL47_9LAMI